MFRRKQTPPQQPSSDETPDDAENGATGGGPGGDGARGEGPASREPEAEARGAAPDSAAGAAAGTAAGAAAGTAAGAADGAATDVGTSPQGPHDAADAPSDGLQRMDLGCVQVPVPQGAELRVEVDSAGRPLAVTVTTPAGAVQLSAFAAPRTAGIWDEVRAEIRAGLSSSGGLSEERDGPFGTELYASVPVTAANGSRSFTPARFWGVDGPRWFLRALLTGAAATDARAAAALEGLVRRVVVVRDPEPRPVREPLPVVLPPEMAEQAASKATELRETQAREAAEGAARQRAAQAAAQREISRRAAAQTGGAWASAAPASSPPVDEPPPAAGPPPARPADEPSAD